MDGRWMDGERMDGLWIDGYMNGWMGRWMNRWVHGWRMDDRWMDELTDGRWMEWWMGGWMDGGWMMDGWMGGWMDGWKHFLLLFALNSPGHPSLHQESLIIQPWTRESKYESETALSKYPAESQPGRQKGIWYPAWPHRTLFLDAKQED